jgi:hypothetical protein
MSKKPEWCLDSKITGKRFSEVQTLSVNTKQLREMVKELGRPNGEGRYVIGNSFDDRIEDWRCAAEACLKKAGLPYTPKVFEVKNKPDEWIDSSDPEDVLRAVEAVAMYNSLNPDAQLPTPRLGKKRKSDIAVSWEMEKPPNERLSRIMDLGSYIRGVGDGSIKVVGIGKKTIEKCQRDYPIDLAARIIMAVNRLKNPVSEADKIEQAFNLGEMHALVKVYGIESTGAGRAGKAPKKKDWATELASQLLEKTENFGKAWKLISDDRGHTDAPTVVRTVKEGKESVEHLEGAPPYQSLTKDSFRTEYFQPAKKILKNLKKSED